eukprot:351632-Chlamydomonas_euryale.AAC.3
MWLRQAGMVPACGDAVQNLAPLVKFQGPWNSQALTGWTYETAGTADVLQPFPVRCGSYCVWKSQYSSNSHSLGGTRDRAGHEGRMDCHMADQAAAVCQTNPVIWHENAMTDDGP